MGLRGRAPVATEAGLARSRDGGNHSGLGVDSPHEVVLHFDKEHIAIVVEANFVGFVQFGVEGGAAIAGIAFSARASHDLGLARPRIDSPDTVVSHLGDIQPAVWPEQHGAQ